MALLERSYVAEVFGVEICNWRTQFGVKQIDGSSVFPAIGHIYVVLRCGLII